MVVSSNKPIAILGGGFSGLAAALELLENGEKVILLESSDQLGGAAVSTSIPEDRRVPVGYHQIVGSDKHLINMIDRLGLMRRVRWKNTHISTFADGKNINLASPKDMMRYKRLPLVSRIRYMIFGARCLITKDWSFWKNKNVTEFVTNWADKNVLAEIFEPLVDIKFGFSTDRADAAWLGLRLSHSEGKTPFGYIPNTSWPEEMIKRFDELIKNYGGVIKLNSPVKSLIVGDKGQIQAIEVGEKKIEVKAVISTIPTPVLYSVLKKSAVPQPWLKIIGRIKYISCYSLLAGLPFTPFPDYWTIALQPRKVFGGCFTVSHLNKTLITKKDKAVINLFTNLEYGKHPWKLEEYAKQSITDLEKMIGKKIKPNWIQTNIIHYVYLFLVLAIKTLLQS